MSKEPKGEFGELCKVYEIIWKYSQKKIIWNLYRYLYRVTNFYTDECEGQGSGQVASKFVVFRIFGLESFKIIIL